MTGYTYADESADDTVTSPISMTAAARQLATYQRVIRIPAEIVLDVYGTPTVEMPVSASYCALIMPAPMVDRILLRLIDAAAVIYPLEGTAAVLMFPDARLTPTMAAAFDRAGIMVAAYGSRVRLPVDGADYPWRWLRPPTAPAFLPRLSDLLMTTHWIGIAGPRARTA